MKLPVAEPRTETVETVPPPSEFRSQWLLSPSGLLQLLLRVGFASAGGAVGLGALAFLQRGEWTATGKIQVDADAVTVATAVAFQCQIVLAGLALLTELALCLSLWGHFWRWGQVFLPFAWGILGGSLFFPPPAYHPKEILLLSGSTLITFIAGISYVLMWQNSLLAYVRLPELSPRRLPSAWLVVLILLGSALLGSATGWSRGHPAFHALWEYRTDRWSEPEEPSELRPIEESIPFL